MHFALRLRSASCTRVQARSDLAKSDEQWFAQLRLEVERVTRAHMQVGGTTAGQNNCMICHTCSQEMDQCERRLQDARTARDGDRAEQAAAMAAANAQIAELQKALQQLQASRKYVTSYKYAKHLHVHCRNSSGRQSGCMTAAEETLTSKVQQTRNYLRKCRCVVWTFESVGLI